VDAIAVWSHDTGNSTLLYDIYYSFYDASMDTWWSLASTPTTAIANLPGNDFWPAISFDHTGKAMVVWSHDTLSPATGFDIYYSRWLGPFGWTWTIPAPIAAITDADRDPAVALWSNGDGVAVWVNSGASGASMYYSLLTSGIWGIATLLSSPWPLGLVVVGKQPEVAYDIYHNAIAIWTDMSNSSTTHVYYSVLFNNLNLWTNPNDLDPGQPNGVAVETRKGISPDRLGNAKAVWNPENIAWENHYSLWHGTSGSSGTFSPAAPIFPGSPYASGLGTAVAFDQQNNAIAIHGSDRHVPTVWSNREVGGGWNPEQQVDLPFNLVGIPEYSEPRVAYLKGIAVAVWTGFGVQYGPDNNIFYRVWKSDPNPYLGHWTLGGPIDPTPGGLIGDDGPWWGPVSIASYNGGPTSPSLKVGDLGGGVPPQFFKFDEKVDSKDLALFLQCFKGLGPP
jgi:hypothetical protein